MWLSSYVVIFDVVDIGFESDCYGWAGPCGTLDSLGYRHSDLFQTQTSQLLNRGEQNSESQVQHESRQRHSSILEVEVVAHCLIASQSSANSPKYQWQYKSGFPFWGSVCGDWAGVGGGSGIAFWLATWWACGWGPSAGCWVWLNHCFICILCDSARSVNPIFFTTNAQKRRSESGPKKRTQYLTKFCPMKLLSTYIFCSFLGNWVSRKIVFDIYRPLMTKD